MSQAPFVEGVDIQLRQRRAEVPVLIESLRPNSLVALDRVPLPQISGSKTKLSRQILRDS
jgi:hypothetical protein